MKRGTKDLMLTMIDCERRLVHAGLWKTVKVQREALRTLREEIFISADSTNEDDKGFDENGDLA